MSKNARELLEMLEQVEQSGMDGAVMKVFWDDNNFPKGITVMPAPGGNNSIEPVSAALAIMAAGALLVKSAGVKIKNVQQVVETIYEMESEGGRVDQALVTSAKNRTVH